MKRGDDNTATPIKILFFGEIGSGKSSVINGLLLQGLRVLVATTDVGGSGLNSVKLWLRQQGRAELLENLYEVELNGDDEVQDFMDEPAAFFPDVYDVGIDLVFWDGFSGWQQVDLSEKIGKIPIERTKDKELQPAVESGLFFEQGQWGMMRNATVRTLDKFCSLNNRKTGQIWHKIVTCQEGIKSKSNTVGSGFIETKEPLLQGAGGVLSAAAFDLIVRTKVAKQMVGEVFEERYFYEIKGENKKTKSRGFVLAPVIEADMFKLWASIEEQLGISRGAIDPNKVAPILIEQTTIGEKEETKNGTE